VNPQRPHLITAMAALGGACLALLIMSPLFIHGISPVTSGLILGLGAAICLVGVVYGVWNARRLEAKRRAKEDIWMKH
jgi:hypothetical protein